VNVIEKKKQGHIIILAYIIILPKERSNKRDWA